MILYLKIEKKFIEGEDALWTSKTKRLHLNEHLDATAQFTFQLGVFFVSCDCLLLLVYHTNIWSSPKKCPLLLQKDTFLG